MRAEKGSSPAGMNGAGQERDTAHLVTAAAGPVTATHCMVCRSADLSDLFRATDHLVSGRQFLIRRCNSCGMGWTAEPPSEAEAGSYYLAEEYISHTDTRKSLTDRLYHLARSYMLRRKERVVASLPGRSSGKAIIDIGSGTGYFAAHMQQRGWQVTTVEVSDSARALSEERFGITPLPPDRVTAIPDRSADCITFWHVLEHLYDPAAWLTEVGRILRDKGRCIIALPNFISADASWFGSRWAALDVPRHLWHFTPEAVERLAEGNGFTVEKIRSMPLDLFYISILSYRNSPVRMPLLRGLMTGTLLTLLSCGRKKKSSSLIYQLSKKEIVPET